MTEQTLPKPEMAERDALGEVRSDLRGYLASRIDRILDNPDKYAITPSIGEHPQYHGSGKRQEVYGYTKSNYHIEVARTLETEPEMALDPDRLWATYTIQVDACGMRAYGIFTEDRVRSDYFSLQDNPDLLGREVAMDVDGLEDTKAFLELVLEDALR